jgi:hypothetical protein
MIVPVRVGEGGKEPKDPSDYAGWTRADVNWIRLAQCLTFPRTDHTQVLATAIEKTCSLGATPFEVIAGTPHRMYGARITFVVPPENGKILAEWGLSNHPWGAPQWIGLRSNEKGHLRAKGYYKLAKLDRLPFARDFAKNFSPVMSSVQDDVIETYARFHGSSEWIPFVRACTQPLSKHLPDFQPLPRSVGESFCVSVKSRCDSIQAISVFADYRALPEDDTIRHLWSRDMSCEEQESYELTLAGVRSCGRRRLGSWHAMLGWTLESSGVWHKAASLRFPAIGLGGGRADAPA